MYTSVGCCSAGPPDLGIVCIDVTLLTRLSASLIALVTVLAASTAACVIDKFLLWSVAIFALLFLRLPCVSLLVFCKLVCLLWDFLPFTAWHHVMLIIFNDDNTTGSSWLCHLYFVPCIRVVSDYVYKTIIDMCLCLLLVATCTQCYWLGIFYFWYASMWIFCNYGYICVSVSYDIAIVSMKHMNSDNFYSLCWIVNRINDVHNHQTE